MAGGEVQGPIRINKHVLKKAAICRTMGWKIARQEKALEVELATLFKQGNDVETLY